MKILESIAEFRASAPRGSAFVPTMGALHDGHLSLFRAAQKTRRPVTGSIFVNPLQFGPNEDYAKYPRTLERDAELAESAGVEFLFCPTAAEMFPGDSTTVSVPKVTTCYEGERRPGHFDGVATVVCKLFQIVLPDFAYFGLKDLQQCAVLDRMVRDLQIPLKLCFEPTIRESDGLAMSSRNVYLTPNQRASAPHLYRQLLITRQDLLKQGEPASILRIAKENLSAFGFEVDYYDLIDKTTFHPVHRVIPSGAIIAAAKLGNTRLIDNVLLSKRDETP